MADIAIVGAGFLGLSTAIHLAEAGARVTVLEAGEPGSGSSGRNTGFVIPNVPTPNGPDSAVRAFGAEAGEWLVGHIGGAADFAFALIDRLGIDCQADRLGWAQAAHSQEMLSTLEQIARGWQAYGFDVELLDAAATESLLGFSHYPGSMFFRTGGQLNPLAYVRGLARAAVARGVQLHTATPVTGIERPGDRWVLQTPHGRLSASRVIVTVNVAMDGLVGDQGEPLRISHMRQAATFPLSPMAAFQGPKAPFSDTAPHPNLAMRTTRDGRLVTGGEPDLARRRLAQLLPPDQPVEIEFTWGGDTAHTPDLLPRYVELAPGLAKAIGCNGRGVAVASMLGARIAEHIAYPERSGGLLMRLHPSKAL